MESEERLKQLTDIILQVAMAHHEDISMADEDNACECAEKIMELYRTAPQPQPDAGWEELGQWVKVLYTFFDDNMVCTNFNGLIEYIRTHIATPVVKLPEKKKRDYGLYNSEISGYNQAHDDFRQAIERAGVRCE